MNTPLIIAGNRGDYELGPGPKVVLVASGGTLELHGKRKLSWTKLNKTAEKTENTDHLLYDHLVSYFLIQTIVLVNKLIQFMRFWCSQGEAYVQTPREHRELKFVIVHFTMASILKMRIGIYARKLLFSKIV